MSVTAPIQDLLIRIKNSYMARRTHVKWVWYSRFTKSVLDILLNYKFIKSYEILVDGVKKSFDITLFEVNNPTEDIPVVRFFSVPSRRWYVSYKDLKPVAGWQWIGIISTSKWVLPTHKAKQMKVGGELIAEIY